ncbi:MAG: c-type cytochrome [Cupriavidus necator]
MSRAASRPSRWIAAGLFAVWGGAAGFGALARTPADDAAAYRHYTLACMGCHGPDGEGVPNVIPPLARALGQFVQSPAGREFIIRVPGAANSALSDEELALVTNMLVRRFSADTMPASFTPYTAQEVAVHRRPALREVREQRRKVVTGLREIGVPAAYEY